MNLFLHPSEVDKRLQLPAGRALRLARRGKLPAIRLPDGTIRIPEAALEAFLTENRVKPRAPTAKVGAA